MKLIFALILMAFIPGISDGANLWVNNITINEYNMTWSYTETLTGIDSMTYRISIDTEIGNNDSFINAWEVLKADMEMRKRLGSSIDKELDVRINNQTTRVDVFDVESTLSPELLGRTHSADTIVNRYYVTYRFKDSIFNASSIWFLGQANTTVTIIMPAGVDVINISGMDNVTRDIADHTEITGFFKAITTERGEITLDLKRNNSIQVPEINVTLSGTDNITSENITKPMAEALSWIRDVTILVAGAVIILLIYIFKVRKR